MRPETVLVLSSTPPASVAKGLAKRLGPNFQNAEVILADFVANNALEKFGPIIPHLLPEHILTFLRFPSFQTFIIDNHTFLSSDIISTLIFSGATPVIQGLPPTCVVDALSQTCEDLGEVLGLISPLSLPTENESAILSQFAERGTGASVSKYSGPLTEGTPPSQPAASPIPTNSPTSSAATPRLGESAAPTKPLQQVTTASASPAAEATANSRKDLSGKVVNVVAQHQTSLLPSDGSGDENARLPSKGSQSSYAPSHPGTPSPVDDQPQSDLGDSPSPGVPPAPPTVPPPNNHDTGDADTNDGEADDGEADDGETDDGETDDEDIYEGADILSPTAFYKWYERYINKPLWKLLESHRCSYTEEKEDRSKWPAALVKHSHSNDTEVDLPPVLDPAHEKLRKHQWGKKHSRILAVETKRFLALPTVIKLCAGSVNSAQTKGDIFMRRFWALYMHVACCITDRVKLQEANSQLIEFTFLRFGHLALNTTNEKTAKTWLQPIRNALNTFKSCVIKEVEKAPSEPKVKPAHMQHALSFVAGELRRSGAPNLWAKGAGASDVNKEVTNRLEAFAQEKGVHIDDHKEFTDASAPMARSFLDSVAEETGAVALLAYAVKTSEGPILVVKPNLVLWIGDYWPDALPVELGELNLITADSAVPADDVDHPWTAKKKSLPSEAPKFQVPVTEENMMYNANLLKQSILQAIRNYSGLSPPFAAILAKPGFYIAEGTRPTFLVEPTAMSLDMLDVWVLYELVPPLRDLVEDIPDDVGEDYVPPRQAKASSTKGPPKAKTKTSSTKGATHSTKPPSKKGPPRGSKKKAANNPAPMLRQLPTQEVFVEIPPSQIDRMQYSQFATPRRPRPSAAPNPATGSTSGHSAMEDIPTEPEDRQVAAGDPVPQDHPTAGTPVISHQPCAATPHTGSLPSPTHSSSSSMDIDSPIPAPIPLLPQRLQAPKANALVLYSSDREPPPVGSQASDDSSGSGANDSKDPEKASSPNTNDREHAAAVGDADVAMGDADIAVPPGDSGGPSCPPKYAAPRRVPAEVRQGRQAQIAFRTSIQYEFKDTVTKEEIKERVVAWAAKIGCRITNFGHFMQEVTAAGHWGITHSDQSLQSLAPLMEAAAVLEWYAACKPLPDQPMTKAGPGRLTIPWTNVAAGSPPSRLFTILHGTGDSVPLLSFLLSKEGGWSISDMAHFAQGLIGSVSRAVAGSVARFENILYSCVDPIPIGRALILLHQSRSLFKTAPEYNGPTEQLIGSITDTAILVLNGLALTIAQQPSWWYKFSGTDAVKPKPLSFTSKSNVYANKLPQWCTGLHEFEWLALTGMDRASVGILVSVAVMQIYQSCELDERTALEQCARLLLHVQYIARACTTHQFEVDGGPLLDPITELDTAASAWPGNSTWATTEAGATAVPLESETEGALPSLTSSVDHDLAALSQGSLSPSPGPASTSSPTARLLRVPGLSPQKGRASLAVPYQGSPSPSPGPSSAPSPTPGQVAVVPEATAVTPAPPLSAPAIPPSSPLSEPPEVDSEDEGDTANLPPWLKRKRSTSPTSDSSKRTRTERPPSSSEPEQPLRNLQRGQSAASSKPQSGAGKSGRGKPSKSKPSKSKPSKSKPSKSKPEKGKKKAA
ncbi:hypothetical protein FRC05_006576 [Tulasnella sp. 425]|nr:hypothetical protein FRC05_006576 [Tulasnella sp. 425]